MKNTKKIVLAFKFRNLEITLMAYIFHIVATFIVLLLP